MSLNLAVSVITLKVWMGIGNWAMRVVAVPATIKHYNVKNKGKNYLTTPYLYYEAFKEKKETVKEERSEKRSLTGGEK